MEILSGYIGSYTSNGSKGIYYFEVDTDTDKFLKSKLAYEIENPTYLIEKDKFIFTTCSEDESGGVASFSTNDDHSLNLINKRLLKGKQPCHITVNKNSTLLFSCNYHKNQIISYRLSNGSITKEICEINHKHLPNETPHIHYVGLSRDELELYALDLGLDKLYIYSNVNGFLTLKETMDFPKGTGPRHMIISEDIFVISELTGEVFYISKVNGKQKIIHSIKLYDDDTIKEGAAIRYIEDKKLILVSERTKNEISILKVLDNKLTKISSYSSQGIGPRDFNISNSNDYLICGNQLSNNLSLYKIDDKGALNFCHSLSSFSPICVAIK